MQQYGIDGVFLQRFLGATHDRSTNVVLHHVRTAANLTGRAFAITYDMTGTRSEKILDALVKDWKWLIDEVKITEDKRYLHHGGKPVLMIYGFFTDRFSPELAHRIIQTFKGSQRYGVTLIGGSQWPWRAESDPGWATAFRSFDVIMPWNVGNVTRQNGVALAATGEWPADILESRRWNMGYMPVVYPGFSWDNLQQKRPGGTNIPRLHGQFLWRQFYDASRVGADAIYVAMFDEVDEGTAIFKVTNTPPTQAHFVTYERMPSDWYLRLTGEATRWYRRGRGFPAQIPIRP